jgi:dihydrofolate reductase
MRKVIVSILVSLDGSFEGPNKELDWHVWDNEMEKYMGDFLNTVDAILLGRVAYQLLADYWPTSTENLAPRLNNLPKIVFSKTLQKVEWKNSRLIKENIKEEILKIKQQPGKDMVILGSASIVQTFTNLGLIDEYRLLLHPVALGSGKPLFKDINDMLNLKLLKTKTYKNGVVSFDYQPIKK